ncbi:MAG: NAD(P)H-hydrate dehydratase [Lachnospiraceae bacterium]|nr:NAD(P)H-hydrate dehydratase [Lachnospiraceae bacterium]
MEIILNKEQMQALDSATIRDHKVPSVILMERAGLSVVSSIEKMGYPSSEILVLCGCGNNGGDGFCIARLYAEKGKNVSVFIYGNTDNLSEASRIQYETCLSYGVKTAREADLNGKELIIDALFGIGLNRELREDIKKVIRSVNKYRASYDNVRVVSVDIASGVFADTGAVKDTAIKADMTVTFAHKKTGQLIYPGAEYTGILKCTDIGITDLCLDRNEIYAEAIENTDLPVVKRIASSNKGTYGKVLLIAGSKDTAGCMILSARACFKTGAGMIRVLTHKDNRELLLKTLPEAMISVYEDMPDRDELDKLYGWADVIGIGPGIGTDKRAEELLLSSVSDNRLPIVIDADAIRLFKRTGVRPDPSKKMIFTPHMGEMSYLTDTAINEIKEDPVSFASRTAKKLNAVIALKDARTVIADKDGRIRINTTGNNGMSVAGMGDVLLGIITGLLAQGTEPFDAASFGVYIHGSAGDRGILDSSKSGLMPSELIDNIKYFVE